MKIKSRPHLTFGEGPPNSASFFWKGFVLSPAISGKLLMKDYSIWAGWGWKLMVSRGFRRSWDSEDDVHARLVLVIHIMTPVDSIELPSQKTMKK